MNIPANQKDLWVANDGEESEFVSIYGRKLGLILNPAKVEDRYAPDLYCWKYETLGDLKMQKTPYLTAVRYGVDTDRAATLNVLDLVRYGSEYGNRFLIYFWILHDPGKINGVYCASVKSIVKDICMNRRRIHEYQTRDGTDGNKTHSYVLDFTAFTKVSE